MPFRKLPIVTNCCHCVHDLKIAAAMIAVIGIITCPLVSWAFIRHSYVIRMSCTLTTNKTLVDVVDINVKNILSFGFGPNAGLGPSCFGQNSGGTTKVTTIYLRASPDGTSDTIMEVVKYFGWFVLAVDFVFLICAILFLVHVFQGDERRILVYFMISTSISILFSFLYGVFYLAVCIHKGGGFPVFEVFFTIFDLILWIYFLAVLNSYRRRQFPHPSDRNV